MVFVGTEICYCPQGTSGAAPPDPLRTTRMDPHSLAQVAALVPRKLTEGIVAGRWFTNAGVDAFPSHGPSC